jgi:hypothetical protein
MRYFIFFYRCQDEKSKQYGEQGYIGEILPSSAVISKFIADNTRYTPNKCALLSFNEVSEQDYNSFFGREQE